MQIRPMYNASTNIQEHISKSFLLLIKLTYKNPPYGAHQLSRPMRIVGPIKFWKGCVIYLYKKINK